MTEFFKQIWQMVIDSNFLYIVGAVLILLIGWLIALWCSRSVSKALTPLLCKPLELPDKTGMKVCCHANSWAGKIVYYTSLFLRCLRVFRFSDCMTPQPRCVHLHRGSPLMLRGSSGRCCSVFLHGLLQQWSVPLPG